MIVADDPNILKMSLALKSGHVMAGSSLFTTNQSLILLGIVLGIVFLNLTIASLVYYRYQ